MQQSEYIPDNHDLYRRALPIQYNKTTGKFTPATFTLRKKEIRRGLGLSVNWSEYSTPEETSVDPHPNYGGRRLLVGALKARIPRQQDLKVVHTPNLDNPAHSEIRGRRLIDSHSRLLVADILAENCRPLITRIEDSNL
ncbi:hypothetical protein CEE34_00895 [Candidatus Aerophobetes bacterium Ae_b3a]|nr:MAG: hypothetical protein CEE34_00895 [Candidatus Aerophobetes bacterium Ae_b3a]